MLKELNIMNKLIGVDLDGTLLNSKNEISSYSKKIIDRTLDQGHKVAIITGRDYYSSIHIAKELFSGINGGLLASSNGAHVYDLKSNETIINHIIKKEVVKDIIRFSRNLGLTYFIYKDNKVLVDTIETYDIDYIHTKNKIDIVLVDNLEEHITEDLNKVVISGKPDKIRENIEKIKGRFSNEINPICSMPQFIDCIPAGINKGVCINELGKYYNIDRKYIVSFGDGINDIEMLEASGIAVSMGNAVDSVKKISDYVGPSNHEDGVAKFIENYVLID